MKYVVGIMVLVLACMASCKPDEVVAHTSNVEIAIEIKRISAGYANVEFTPDKNAFYLSGIHPVREDIDDIQKVAKQFMMLALDSAYVDYLYWRNKQLQQLTPFVTDFASYALQYGKTNQYFTMLKPNTDYWVYAFVVDATTNKPTG